MKTALLTALAAAALVGCKPAEPPGPPRYDDVKNIVINGKKLTAREYHKTYCVEPSVKLGSPYCLDAERQALLDARNETLSGPSSIYKK